MVVKLPKFEDKYGLILTVCGKLKSPVTKTRGKEPEIAPVAKYETLSGKTFIRACITGTKGTHLHVDCAISRFFPKGRIPKITCKKENILSTIESTFGKEIDSQVEACFDIPFSDLPEKGTIRSLYYEQKYADISMQLTGAEVTFTGIPLQKIRWNIRKEKKSLVARVWLRGKRVTVVSDKYLLESWDWINEQLSIFVLGKRKNA